MNTPRTPESAAHLEALKLEAGEQIARSVSALLNSSETKHTDGVRLDLSGEEVDDPADAQAVGSISRRVISVSDVPVAVRGVYYREIPEGLRIPDNYIKTDVIFSEPLSESASEQLPVRISVLQRATTISNKEIIGATARYIEKENDEYTEKDLSPDEETRILKNVAKELL